MEVSVENVNDLLKRKEVVLSAKYESNPGFASVSKDVAKHFKVEENRIVVKRIGSSFGRDDFVIEAFVYESAQEKEKIEPKKKEKKK